MTQRKRGRPPGSRNKPKMQGDDGRKHLRGERLTIGDDVSHQTAAKMVEFGTAMLINGMSLEEQEQAQREAASRQIIRMHKQRADWVMEQFDRQSPETRERLREYGDDHHE